ncbi:hypothetical protein N7468_004463 [Penicillium chermesinum]|uniref:Uncharacterized protein n=1 Tax=Penicillium chermesinum TaxID=63820 RepID=A0A9W9TUC9_9EURO|nr:uncharacterized protein N7468_004463 [Penicillium chermesinum]KAJ5239844.1 hypothetical protein N7468_004463 [Penicillium chermesinum]KAJ6166722.1 hypothetical protein N7470_002169 [Penicillium chermesinum]
MCDVPFIPIFPICFQCGTDQNPCHCKVVGPTLGKSFLLSPGDYGTCRVSQHPSHSHAHPNQGDLLASFDLLRLRLYQDRERVCLPFENFSESITDKPCSMLGFPVKLNGQVSNAIPF